MSSVTPLLDLPYLLPAQAQKHVTVNEALRALDVIVQASIINMMETAPPISPAGGDAYIIAATATGDWVGRENQLAAWQDGAWAYHIPKEGWRIWDKDSNTLWVFDGTDWMEVSTGGGLDLIALGDGSVTQLGINTSADGTNRLAVKSDAILLSHDDVTPGSGDIRVNLNKAASANTAAFLFQNNYSGRAEMGLAGDDNFTLNVSDDGAAFARALHVDTATGNVSIGAEGVAPSTDKLYVRKDFDGRLQFTVNNLATTGNPSCAFRLNGANSNYFNFQMYGMANVTYAYTNTKLYLGTYAAKDMILRTNTQDRMKFHADGRVSVNTSAGSAQFAVNGAVRVGNYTVATMPSASTNGAGALIYVTDESGGATLAFSDGAEWRRMRDSVIIS